MRILLANESRSGSGGVESYLASVAAALRHAGHDVALLYANPRSEQGPTSVETEASWSVADLGLVRSIESARAWGPDACFAHNMRYLEVDDALVAAWPTVKMMHAYAGACLSGHKAFSFPALKPCARVCGAGCLTHFLPRRCGRLRPDVMVTQYVWAMAQQRLLARYRAVVVASDHMRREFARYCSADRIATIPLFAPPVGRASAATDRPIDVVFLGRLTPLKGADVLLEALHIAGGALGRPVTAVIAGEGPAGSRLERRAARLQHEGSVSVRFPGWVNEAGRDDLLSKARLLAMPSRWPEPFGLVGLEAAASGVPTVAFDVGGIPTWLTPEVNGVLVPPAGGAPALGAAIAGVLNDPARYARLAVGSLDAARHFSAAAHVAALERLLEACRSPGTC